ncbi:MAG TPA: DUF6624 domain-containing protein [Ktedonobacteraceae bacterium]|nr:DUF6624 domain-containing protein [Ktedonobacteraceae bacterium]
MDETLRAELLAMEQHDRKVRAELVERGELHQKGYHPEMQAIHSLNNARMHTILETYGWPGKSLVGMDGCRAAGFIIQHAMLDLDLQERGLQLLTEAVSKGEAEPFMLAFLADRVLMQEDRPQIYGTQYVEASDGGLEPWPIENPAEVDQRRRSVGLMPLAENTARLNKLQREEKHQLESPSEETSKMENPSPATQTQTATREHSLFVLLLTFIKPRDEVDRWIEAHLAYISRGYISGHFLTTGRQEPRTGGVILARAASKEQIQTIIKEDPFLIEGVAEYNVIEFHPSRSAPGLELLLERYEEQNS